VFNANPKQKLRAGRRAQQQKNLKMAEVARATIIFRKNKAGKTIPIDVSKAKSGQKNKISDQAKFSGVSPKKQKAAENKAKEIAQKLEDSIEALRVLEFQRAQSIEELQQVQNKSPEQDTSKMISAIKLKEAEIENQKKAIQLIRY
jgi:hypothetical protein